MRFLRHLGLGCALAVAVSIVSFSLPAMALSGPDGGGQKSADISNPKGMILDYSPTAIGRVLTDMGLNWKVEDIDGNRVVFSNVYGMTVLFLVTSCDDPGEPRGCTDLQMLSLFTGRAVSPTNLMRFNATNLFAFAGSGEDGGIFFRRFDFEVHGVTRENLRTSILSFRGFADQFFGSFRMSILDAPSTQGLSVRPSDNAVPFVPEIGTIGKETDIEAFIASGFAKDNFVNTLTDAD